MFFVARLFFLGALLTPLWLVRSTFFPFISVKAVYFRSVIELALLFFIFAVVFSKKPRSILLYYWKRLKNPLVLAVAVFGLVYLLTALAGIYPSGSVWSNFERGEGAFQIIHYVLFFILAVLLLDSKKWRLAALYSHLCISILVSLYGLTQLIYNTAGVAPRWVIAASGRASGTLGNPSYLAAYLIFTLAMIIYLFKETRFLGWRIVLGLVFLFETYILLKTGTRGAFLGVIGAGLVFLAINIFLTKKKRLRLLFTGALLTPVIVVIVFFSTAGAPAWKELPVFGRLINFRSAVVDIQPRLWTWGSAVAATFERPLLGWGSENFAAPFDTYYNPKHYLIESFFDRTHNVFLEYSVSGGLVLLLAWLAIFFFYYRELFRRKKDWWWAVLFGVPMAYFIQGFFLFDVLAIYLVLFLFLALFKNESLEEKNDSLSISFGLNKFLVSIIGVVIVGISLYATGYRTLEKNRLLARALLLDQGAMNLPVQNQQEAQLQISSLKRTRLAYEEAYAYKSLVGRDETLGSMMKFAISMEEKTQRIPALANTPQARAELKALVDRANEWFKKTAGGAPGFKDDFLNSVINIQFSMVPTPDGKAMTLVDGSYFQNGANSLEALFAQAPTRIEFVRVLIKLAQITGNKEKYDKWIEVANELRPDIKWESQ